MKNTLIVIAGALLVAPSLFAQHPSSRAWNNRSAVHQRPNVAENAGNPAAVVGDGMTTPSGVRYWEIKTGAGEAATTGRVVKVLFTQWVENGREIASSSAAGRPFSFKLGEGQVIRGWEEGMEGMKVGGLRQLRIPPSLAYGQSGLPPLVPAGATVIIEVQLLNLQ